MALTFPNLSRSYDAVGKRIRFLGYDGMSQICFFIPVEAISRNVPDAVDAEANYLAAFDAERNSIYGIAQKAYSRGRKNMHVLTSADL
jgi:hypothetical protein